MKADRLQQLKKKMMNQRKELLGLRRGFDRSWQELQEPERELEETAEKEKMAQVVEQLGTRDKEIIEAIDVALRKIELGGYGSCESCGNTISQDRLDAIPWARHCKACKSEDEPPEVPAAETLYKPPLPPELQGMSDEELCIAIYDELRRDNRVDFEELRISCKKGEVELSGALPSEDQRHILMEIIKDLMGLKRIRDRIEIDEVLWERKDRTPGTKRPTTSSSDNLMYGAGSRPETHESIQEGAPMDAPDKFVPEREE